MRPAHRKNRFIRGSDARAMVTAIQENCMTTILYAPLVSITAAFTFRDVRPLTPIPARRSQQHFQGCGIGAAGCDSCASAIIRKSDASAHDRRGVGHSPARASAHTWTSRKPSCRAQLRARVYPSRAAAKTNLNCPATSRQDREFGSERGFYKVPIGDLVLKEFDRPSSTSEGHRTMAVTMPTTRIVGAARRLGGQLLQSHGVNSRAS